MALKAVVTDINTVAEAYRGEYKQVGNEWRLDIDGEVPGFVPHAKFAEFRDNNKKLLDDAARFKDVDPDEYRRLKQDLPKNKEESEKQYQERLAAALLPLKTELDGEKKKTGDLNTELSKLRINDAAIAAGVEFGIKATAQTDLVNRVSAVSKLENGVVTIYDEKGEKRYSTKTGNLLTIKEFVEGMVASAAHLFEPSTGTGSNGGSNGAKSGTYRGPNPFKRGDGGAWNLTKQGELQRDNPSEAKRLAEEAGVKIRI